MLSIVALEAPTGGDSPGMNRFITTGFLPMAATTSRTVSTTAGSVRTAAQLQPKGAAVAN
jgi:hypothetical protein